MEDTSQQEKQRACFNAKVGARCEFESDSGLGSSDAIPELSWNIWSCDKFGRSPIVSPDTSGILPMAGDVTES